MINCSRNNLLLTSCVVALFGVVFLNDIDSAYGQLGGGAPPIAPGDGGPPDDQVPGGAGGVGGGAAGGATGGNQNLGGGGGGQTVQDNNDTVDIEDSATLNLGGSTTNDRNQGFVGATAPGIAESNFVGSASQTFGMLAEGATFGGGVNDGTNSTIPSGTGGGAGGFGGGQNSGSVIRSSLRTRLRPAFSAPRVPGTVMASRFNSNFSRQLGTQPMVGRYQVSVNNRTATLTGTVTNAAESNRLERQLRLQPGIYRIVNQLQVAQ